MTTADVEAPLLQVLVAGRGSSITPVHNITFSNLQFSDATWLQPSTRQGFSEVQAGYTITDNDGYKTEGLCQYAPGGTCPYGAWTKEPGNVQFAYDRDLTFSDDRFVHLGAAALNLDNGSQNGAVTGSVFTDISGNGIEVGNVDMPQAVGSSQTTNVTIADNHLYGFPAEYQGGVAVLVGYAALSTITHNRIDHVAYSGISVGWGGWFDKVGKPSVPNFSHNNVIADNLIFDYMQTLSDGGGIYTQGITGTSIKNGELVTGNVLHDQVDWSFAYHSDNGATFITYTHNVSYNDAYDWCCSHIDYTTNKAGPQGLPNDPQVVEDNYWQQELVTIAQRGLVVSDNHLITGPQQAPRSIIGPAGLQPPYRGIRSWRWAGDSVPTPPDRVTVIYNFGGSAYVTWHPTVEEGTFPIVSYTITGCLVQPSAGQPLCTSPVKTPVGVFESLGYAVIPGLVHGQAYTFTVTAQSQGGSSTPSLPSPASVEGSQPPALPGAPTGLRFEAGESSVSLGWYAPHSAGCTGPWWAGSCAHPMLAYIVRDSEGQSFTVTGLSRLIVSNGGGGVVDVIGNLLPRHKYTFSVSAVTPSGVGPAVKSSPVTPLA